MAAGLGFKDFVTGEVLTAADVDGYLMQGVWVFASAAARDAAVTSPQEGNFAYLKDTNVTTYYTGSAWANLDTTGMTNPMTTTGDTIYSSSGSTPARLGIGTTGQVLTVAGGVPSWATPAAGGGGKVLQVVQASTTTATNNSTTSYADTTLTGTITPTLATSKVLVIVNQEAYSERTNTASLGERGINLKLLRGATVIVDYGTPSDGGFNYSRIRVNGSEADRTSLRFIQPITYLDSPATTSATTYKTTFADAYGGASGLSVVQSGTAPSTITLLEIGA